MTQIGNITDARTALRAARGEDFQQYYLNEGSFRQTFLVNDVVYKINLRRDGRVDGNEAEWANYEKLQGITLLDHWAIPQMSHYSIEGEFIIAAQYIEGYQVFNADYIEIERITGLWDIPGNVIVSISNGIRYIVDIAS